MRQEFERHRYVNQIGVVDTLLFQSHAEYQVRLSYSWGHAKIIASKCCFIWAILRREVLQEIGTLRTTVDG